MTRRERHLKIIAGFPDRDSRFHLQQLIYRHGLKALTDEAVEELTRTIVSSFKHEQRLHAENRARTRRSA